VVIVLVGVSGAGKTTVGHAPVVADGMDGSSRTLDDYHSAANIQKMTEPEFR